MAFKIRVLDSANRTMQRTGYLKLLCAIVNETETSNLNSLGHRLIEKVSRRIYLPLPVDESLRNYVKNRLTDRIFRELRKTVLEKESEKPVSLEIQDICLSNLFLPSRTGRLVKADWRSYPYLGTSLGLIRKGTYSALTRSHVLLSVTSEKEMAGFCEPDAEHNPLLLNDAQALVLLYCLLENDADVIVPLFQQLVRIEDSKFNERSASIFLPEVFRKIIKKYQDRSNTIEERDRLALLRKIAATIDNWKNKSYTGGGAPQNNIRVRLEPYCDIGFLDKPNQDRYDYQITDALCIFLKEWENDSDTDLFLQNRFFKTFAMMRGLYFRDTSMSEAVKALVQAGTTLQSSLGYSPITDVGLLAGIRLLTEKGMVLELAKTVGFLKALQKRDPEFVRFTVNRMGVMANVKFLKPEPGDMI